MFCQEDKYLPVRQSVYWNGKFHCSIFVIQVFQLSYLNSFILLPQNIKLSQGMSHHINFSLLIFQEVDSYISITTFLCVLHRTEIWNYLRSIIFPMPNITTSVHIPIISFLVIATQGPATFILFPIQLKLSFAIRAFHLKSKYNCVTTILKILCHLFIDYRIKFKL